MPVELTDDEIETVRALLNDWGWEYGLTAERAKVAELAKRLKLPNLARDLEI